MGRVFAAAMSLGLVLSAGASLATESTEESAEEAVVCKRAMVNPITGAVYCVNPRGAPVEAPPPQKAPPCKPGKQTGEAWTFGPACSEE